MDVQPYDRMLLVGQLPVDELKALAASLSAGSLTLSAPSEAVADLRRELRDIGNVLIVPSEQDGTIPWADGYFSVLWAPHAEHAEVEFTRVLVPGGRCILGPRE